MTLTPHAEARVSTAGTSARDAAAAATAAARDAAAIDDEVGPRMYTDIGSGIYEYRVRCIQM